MLGPSSGALRCFQCGEERRCATDLVLIILSEDLVTAEERGYRVHSALFLSRDVLGHRAGCYRLRKTLLPDLVRYRRRSAATGRGRPSGSPSLQRRALHAD